MLTAHNKALHRMSARRHLRAIRTFRVGAVIGELVSRRCACQSLRPHVFRWERFSAPVSLVLSGWATPLILSGALSASLTRLAARPGDIARRAFGSMET